MKKLLQMIMNHGTQIIKGRVTCSFLNSYFESTGYQDFADVLLKYFAIFAVKTAIKEHFLPPFTFNLQSKSKLGGDCHDVTSGSCRPFSYRKNG